MRGARRGIVLPVVLLTMVALALLSALALSDAVQEWRVATLSDDAVAARAALLEGVDAAASPPDLAALCVLPALMEQSATAPAAGGGRYRITWAHLGGGIVRLRIRGEGPRGAREGAVGLVRPDSGEVAAGLFSCPDASGLVPAAGGWLAADPGG